ncbi:18353_t:CDS:2, partial [Racocetra persica]
ESQYKEKLLVEMQQNGENLPLFNKLREENNVLKAFIEGCKLGQEKGKLTVPDQPLKERADILQNVRSENETEKLIGKIIYAVKDEDK